MDTDKPIEAMTFEEALERLEGVALALEQGDVALEEALQQYELATKLKQRLFQQLAAAEEKVKVATESEDGGLALADLDVAEE
jgi:exodeoxyribonuclease VII small subunit